MDLYFEIYKELNWNKSIIEVRVLSSNLSLFDRAKFITENFYY